MQDYKCLEAVLIKGRMINDQIYLNPKVQAHPHLTTKMPRGGINSIQIIQVKH